MHLPQIFCAETDTTYIYVWYRKRMPLSGDGATHRPFTAYEAVIDAWRTHRDGL